jgi:protein-disulfide isomerase-like protein with CxxC motif
VTGLLQETPRTLKQNIQPEITHTLVAISEHTGMTFSQVTDEVLYTGLIEMQELAEHEE